MATTAAAMICPHGHGPGEPGSLFCVQCGTQLVGAVAPGPAAPGGATPTTGLAPQISTRPTAVAAPQVWTPAPASGPSANQPVQMWTPQGQPMTPQAQGPPAGWTPAPQGPVAPNGPPPKWTPPPPQAKAGKGSAALQPPCTFCGDGTRLDPAEDVCPQCGWLRPFAPGYQIDRSVFLWAQDGQAMAKLQSISALHTVVKAVSDKVGRPWIESTFNAIRLGPRQLPDIWKQAILAARILGLPKMPDVYISGDQMWNTYTYGTESNSFIVLGTSHLINFANDEMLFVLAREMGHCRAGHALWKTVIRFLAGDTAVHSGVLSNGLLNAINPSKLIEGALDLPLMAWSRQSDITADRAGLMAVGDEALARRVLLAWSLRSARLLQQINIEEWMKQESASDDQMTRFTEMTTSSSMYTTRRLHLLGQAAREPELMRWSRSIQPIRKVLAPPPAQLAGLGVGTVKVVKTTTSQTKVVSAGAPGAVALAAAHAGLSSVPVGGAGAAGGSGAAPALTPADSVRVVCSKCQGAMRIPRTLLQGKTELNVRCPQCKSVLTLRPKGVASTQVSGPAGAGTPAQAASSSQVNSAATIHSPAPVNAGAKTTPVAQLPKSAPASTGGKSPSVSRTPASTGRKKSSGD